MEPSDGAADRAVSLYLRPKNSQSSAAAGKKIRCFIGGEWKPRTEFSNRQLDKFDRSGKPPAQSTVSCRVHSNQARRELKCEGPCAKWLPVEAFSKSTRNRGKTWCVDCTDWQLSVEPGYTPYVPPPTDEADEGHLLEDDGEDVALLDEAPGERIEEWIQGNPSELGDYDCLEAATQRPVADTASELSVPNLLDAHHDDLARLPQALSAITLGRASLQEQTPMSVLTPPTYASTAAAARAAPGHGRMRGSAALAGTGAMGMQSDLLPPVRGPGPVPASEDRSVASESRMSSASTFFSDTTAKALSVNQSITSGTSTVWMEAEVAALAHPQHRPTLPPPPQPIEVRNGWARPNQRRTDLARPGYVTSSGNLDHHPQVFQRVTYADADDDSEDEC